MQNEHNGQKTAWLFAGVLMPIAAWLLSSAIPEKQKLICAAGVLAGSLILWMSDALPIAISTLLMICMLPLLGLMSFKEAISNFGINTSLFIMASSGITAALSSSQIPERVTSGVLYRFHDQPRLLLFALGIVVASFSAFMRHARCFPASCLQYWKKTV